MPDNKDYGRPGTRGNQSSREDADTKRGAGEQTGSSSQSSGQSDCGCDSGAAHGRDESEMDASEQGSSRERAKGLSLQDGARGEETPAREQRRNTEEELTGDGSAGSSSASTDPDSEDYDASGETRGEWTGRQNR